MMFTNLICENTNDAVTSNILSSMEKCSEEKKKMEKYSYNKKKFSKLRKIQFFWIK